MYKLLSKLFIKDYKNTNDEKVRVKYGTMAGVVGIITNTFLGVTKVIVGLLTFSISIVGDAVNNITDSISSIVTSVGYKLSAKKADKDHPFGHQRIEFISGLIISVLMLAVGILLLKESITKIITPSEIKFDYVTLIIISLSILVKLWQSIFYKNISKEINSISLKATSKDSLNDVISTSSVVVGIIVYLIFNINIDGYIGCIVSLYVIYSSISLIIESSSPLIGTAMSDEDIKKYKKEIMSYKGVLGVHDIVVHSYGPTKIFMTAHAEVSSNVPILISHDVIDNIEKDFLEKNNIDLTIHLDPIDVDDPYTNKLRERIRELVKGIDQSLDIHDFRIVKGETHTNIIFDIDMPIDYKDDKYTLKGQVEALVKKEDPKFNPVLGIDQMYDRKL